MLSRSLVDCILPTYLLQYCMFTPLWREDNTPAFRHGQKAGGWSIDLIVPLKDWLKLMSLKYSASSEYLFNGDIKRRASLCFKSGYAQPSSFLLLQPPREITLVYKALVSSYARIVSNKDCFLTWTSVDKENITQKLQAWSIVRYKIYKFQLCGCLFLGFTKRVLADQQINNIYSSFWLEFCLRIKSGNPFLHCIISTLTLRFKSH